MYAAITHVDKQSFHWLKYIEFLALSFVSMFHFPCCLSAWACTSRETFCWLADFIVLKRISAPFLSTTAERKIMERVKDFLVKNHISYNCLICQKFVRGMDLITLQSLGQRISSKATRHYCYEHLRKVLSGIPSFTTMHHRVVRRAAHLAPVCNVFRVDTKYPSRPFQYSVKDRI